MKNFDKQILHLKYARVYYFCFMAMLCQCDNEYIIGLLFIHYSERERGGSCDVNILVLIHLGDL